MAEIVGLVASVTAPLELTVATSSFSRELKDGPKECMRLRLAIRSSEAILKTLQETVEEAQADPKDAWSNTIESPDATEGPLEQLRSILKSIKDKLAKPFTGARKLLWPFKKAEVDDLLKNLQAQMQLMNLALENDHIALSKAIRNDTKEINDGIEQLSLAQAYEEKDRILTWLTGLDFSVHLNNRLAERQEGTGKWFIESAEFMDWKQQAGQALIELLLKNESKHQSPG